MGICQLNPRESAQLFASFCRGNATQHSPETRETVRQLLAERHHCVRFVIIMF